MKLYIGNGWNRWKDVKIRINHISDISGILGVLGGLEREKLQNAEEVEFDEIKLIEKKQDETP